MLRLRACKQIGTQDLFTIMRVSLMEESALYKLIVTPECQIGCVKLLQTIKDVISGPSLFVSDWLQFGSFQSYIVVRS